MAQMLKIIQLLFVYLPVFALRALIELLNQTFSKVGNTAFFEESDFQWVKDVEADYSQIRAELEKVLEKSDSIPNFQDVSTAQKYLTKGDDWKTFMLYAYGHRIADNCAHCPNTEAALAKIPHMRSAMFSILKPGKHIPPHRGPYNGVLRYQLGLIIPGEEGQCRIRVGETVRNWAEGKSLVFDDAYNHEAWNESDGVRVILFVDFMRPLPQPFAAINNGFFRIFQTTPLIKQAVAQANKLSLR